MEMGITLMSKKTILVLASIHQIFHEFFYLLEELGKPYISFEIVNAEDVDLHKWTTRELDQYTGVWIHNSRQDFFEVYRGFLLRLHNYTGRVFNGHGTSSRLSNAWKWREHHLFAPRIIDAESVKGKEDIPFFPPYIVRRKVGHQLDVTHENGREKLPRIKVDSFDHLRSLNIFNSQYNIEEFVNVSTLEGLYESWRVGFIEETLYSFSKRQEQSWLVRTTEHAIISPELSSKVQKQLLTIIELSGFDCGLIDFGVGYKEEVIPWEITPAIKFEYYEYTPYNYNAPARDIQHDMCQHIFHLLDVPVSITEKAFVTAMNEVKRLSWT